MSKLGLLGSAAGVVGKFTRSLFGMLDAGKKSGEVVTYPDEWISQVPYELRKEVARHNEGILGSSYREGMEASPTYYHGTSNADIGSFNTNRVFVSKSNKVAENEGGFLDSSFNDIIGRDAVDKSNAKFGTSVYPLKLQGEIADSRRVKEAINSIGAGSANDARVVDGLKGEGFQGMAPSGYETVSFSPSNIRSTNAVFDPAKASSSNLLASNPAAGAGAAGLGLLAMGASDDSEAGVVGKAAKGVLDMATPARMQRAEDMGLDSSKDWYHGTADDIQSFLKSKRGSGTQANSAKKAFWFTDDAETTARSYADHSGTTNKVAALIKEADTAERAGNWDLYDKKLQEAEELESFFMGANENRLQGQNIIPTKLPKDEGLLTVDMKGESFSDGAFGGVNEALDKAKAQGYKGVKFLNLDDAIGHSDKPATHVAIFEPQNIRSKFAKFDPAEANSTSILASKPVAGIGAGVLGAIGASQSNKTYADYSPANLARLRSNDVGSIQAPQSMAASNIAGLMGSANKVGYDDSLLGMVAPQLPSELMNKIAYNDKRGLMDYAKAYAGLLGF